jgi:tetratricopeptide (TPR) repeat protein/tRNA A-37 threonylcarbamoyl transferase component Bud32
MSSPARERAGLVAELFKSAVELPTGERETFLTQQCGSDQELKSEVVSLLSSQARAAGFMERPAIQIAEHIRAQPGELPPGHIIGDYEIVALLGKGGMGEVYLATDRRVARQVALKLIRGGLDREMLTRRFQREQQLLAGLNHPNIAQLYETGVTDDGVPFFAMEYVGGERLDRFVEERGLELRDRLNLFRKLCGAIAYAHQHLVIHRDIKPANIRVTAEGEPKLLDFGIAKLLDEMAEDDVEQTITMQRMLTPEYASPEQVRGDPISTASDVYSLGVVFYELLTGSKPYRFTTRRPGEISRAITEQEPARPSAAVLESKDQFRNPKILRGDLDNIALMALRKEPERRYSSALAFSEDIRRYLEGLPVRARKDTVFYRTTKFAQRHRASVVLAVLMLSALVTALVVTLAAKRVADRRFNEVRQMANSLLFEVEGEIQKGPTKARETLVLRALAYLDNLAREVGRDPTLLVEVAAGYLKVGDIQGLPYRPNLGDTAGALASYAKAERILEPLASSARENGEATRYMSLALQSKGRVQVRAGDYQGAVETQRKAVALAEKLTEITPNDTKYLGLLGDDYVHLGAALYHAGRAATAEEYDQAIESFRKALAIHSRIAQERPEHPDYRCAVAVDYEYIGIAYSHRGDVTGERGDYEHALENHRTEFEIAEGVAAADPASPIFRRLRADAFGEIGLSQLKLGLFAEALGNFQKKLAIFEAIEAADHTNVEARRDLANTRHEVARALAAGGDVAAALAEETKACAVLEALHEAEPENTETILKLIDSCDERGALEEKAKNFAGAKQSYERSLSLWQRIPADKLSRQDLVRVAAIRDRVTACDRELAGR